MPSETVIMNGLAVTRQPAAGPPLVMVHGASAGSWCWEQWLPRFGAAGFDCYAPSLRGHPPSPPDPALGRLTLDDYADDVESVLAGLERAPVLVGHSMGGAVAQLVAARRPVAALVLIGSAPLGGIKYRTGGFNLWVALHGLKSIPGLVRKTPLKPSFRVLRYVVLNRIEPQRQRALFERFVPESAEAGIQVLRGSVTADLSGLSAPKLVLGGTEDRTSPLAMQREIAVAQGATLMTLEGHAHLPMLEPGWEQVADRLLGWLREKGVSPVTDN